MSVPDSTALLTARAISIGRELVRVCDALGQDVAGNHSTLAMDILAAQHDLLLTADVSAGKDLVEKVAATVG